MNCFKRFSLLLVLFGLFSIYAQDSPVLASKDSLITSSWIIGVGMNIVDDSATPFGNDFLKIRQTWNIAPYPSRLSIGRYFKNGLGIEAIGSYNRYKEGKKVDGQFIDAPQTYFAFDAKLSYDLNNLLGETAWFDPYLHLGAGYSSIDGNGRSTANGGFGFNTWFNDRWGLNFNTVGKWGIKKGSTKQLQHSAGVVYRFVSEKSISKKGEEKLVVIKEIEEAMKKRQDSMELVKRMKEEAELEGRLSAEKEKAMRLDQQKQLQEKRIIEELFRDIDSLGTTYFDFNSSYLNQASKSQLDRLAVILIENADFSIEIHGHTDARGSDNYNQWLSERRSNRIKDYLNSRGVDASRLKTVGKGETELFNECTDGIKCSEKKHRENRRSLIKIIR